MKKIWALFLLFHSKLILMKMGGARCTAFLSYDSVFKLFSPQQDEKVLIMRISTNFRHLILKRRSYHESFFVNEDVEVEERRG